MIPERLRKIEELYHAAHADRAVLDNVDSELRLEVEELLRHSGDLPEIAIESTVTNLRPGSKLGCYEIGESLGTGGMGRVFMARDTRLGRAVAIKIAHQQFSERFEREKQVIAALNHPHICTLYDVGPDYLVMELLEGETLSAALKRGALRTDLVTIYGSQIADALAAAHAKGIIHRDLKPGNIMVVKTGVKVLDFGLAKISQPVGSNYVLAEPLTDSHTILGTVAYMSPEQIEGKPCDGRSDIFSLGLVLCEMATGARVFAGSSPGELMAQVIRCEPDLTPIVPPSLQHVIRQCLHREPDRRWSSAEDLRQALVQVARDPSALPVESPSPRLGAPTPSLESSSTRRHLIRVGVAAAAAATIGVTAWSLWPGKQGIPSLAVLPFEYKPSGDEEMEAFAVGLTESLIRKIAGLASLSVKSRAAVSAFNGKHADAQKAGRQLGVGAIVTGSVTRRNAKIHVTAELIDVQTSDTLWGPASFDRNEEDLQLVEDEIANAIVRDGIRMKLDPIDRTALAHHVTQDKEADKLYRLALAHQDKETKSDYLIARDLLLKAVEKDPQFAYAQYALALTYGSMAIDGYEPPAEAIRQLKLHANKALLLDSAMQEVHAVLGGELFWSQHKWREAEQEFVSASAAPGAPVYEAYVYLLWATKRSDEALAMVRKAQEQDPVSLKWRLREGDLLLWMERLDKAEKAYSDVIRDSPEDQRAYFALARLKRVQKQFQAAIDFLAQGYHIARESNSSILDLVKKARGEEGLRKIENMEAQLELEFLQLSASTAYVSPLEFARAHARLGHRDQAFQYISEAFEEGSPGLTMLNLDPAWELVRSDPRFAEAVKRVGLP
jgi:serine/threonine-protein kinase